MTNLKRVVGILNTTFDDKKSGNVYPVKHLYVEYPFKNCQGLRTADIKCKGDNVFNGIEIGDYVTLYYDNYGTCCVINPEIPTDSDLKYFGERNE